MLALPLLAFWYIRYVPYREAAWANGARAALYAWLGWSAVLLTVLVLLPAPGEALLWIRGRGGGPMGRRVGEGRAGGSRPHELLRFPHHVAPAAASLLTPLLWAGGVPAAAAWSLTYLRLRHAHKVGGAMHLEQPGASLSSMPASAAAP